ncbi:MAG: hypothetical protein NTV51_05905 [Verrucomicrobia bacterium]|nr:hypothetical protein [Verrucomicrobiota bacterium]
MRHAERDGYRLFDWQPREGVTIRQLWQSCPELVVGRYLVNASYDSGSLTLSDVQKDGGWRMIKDFAHSARIEDPAEIPHDQFDEWLIFDAPTVVSDFETMVNQGGFTPLDFDWEEKRAAYWSQILALRPLHVLGENDGAYVVTRDPAIVGHLLHT